MKNVLFTLGILALTAGCSRSGEDASWPGFHAGETGQGASVGQSKAHGNVIDKDQGDQRRRARRDRTRRRVV
jgi:hypothetical protein